MKCLHADATYGIYNPTTTRLLSLFFLLWVQSGSVQTKPTWVMGSSWRTEQGRLTSWMDSGRLEPAADSPNYPADLSSRLRAEGGEKEEWAALHVTQIACRSSQLKCQIPNSFSDLSCPHKKINSISCLFKWLKWPVFTLTWQGALLLSVRSKGLSKRRKKENLVLRRSGWKSGSTKHVTLTLLFLLPTVTSGFFMRTVFP